MVLLLVEEGILLLFFFVVGVAHSRTHIHVQQSCFFFCLCFNSVCLLLARAFCFALVSPHVFSQCVARRPACCPLQRVGALFCSFTFAFGDFTVPALFPHRSAGRVSLFSSFVVAPFFHCCSQNELCRVRTPRKCGGSASFPLQVPFLIFFFKALEAVFAA